MQHVPIGPIPPMSKRLPDSVQQIADVIGEEAAVALVAILPRVKRDYPSGDAVLYVPKNIGPDHRFVAAIGYVAAMKLSRYFGGDLMFVATCAGRRKATRNAEILEALKTASPAAVAIRFGITERHVRRIASTARNDIPPMGTRATYPDHAPVNSQAYAA